ncbi:MAG: RecX family transcriptional regulator [Bacteroidota bacterium]
MSESEELRPGTITRLKRQRKRPERVSVYLDEAFAFSVHQDIILEYSLTKGEHLSVERQLSILGADERLRARGRAMDLLSHKARTGFELTQRLSRDGFSDDAVQAAVQRLTELDFIDDRLFALEYASARARNKGYGPERIRYELIRKGINRNLADSTVTGLFASEQSENELATDFARSRLSRLNNESDFLRKKKKLYDALRRRGFSGDVIRRVIADVLREE